MIQTLVADYTKGYNLQLDINREKETTNLIADHLGSNIPIGRFSCLIKEGSKLPNISLESRAFEYIAQDDKILFLHGTGYSHHLAYDMVSRCKGPFTYLHIDAHPDFPNDNSDKISYYSVAWHISRLDQINGVYVLGTRSQIFIDSSFLDFELDSDGHAKDYNIVENPAILRNTPNVFICDSFDNYIRELERIPFGEKNHAFRQLVEKYKDIPQHMSQFHPASIPEDKVYLSIDLDVLKGFPVVDEYKGHGLLNLEELLELIEKITDTKEVIGADICGLKVENSQDDELIINSLDAISTIQQLLYAGMN